MISSEQSEDFIVATPRFHLLFLDFVMIFERGDDYGRKQACRYVNRIFG